MIILNKYVTLYVITVITNDIQFISRYIVI